MSDEYMTVRQVAQALGVSRDTVKGSIRRLFPNLMQVGKTTRLNEEQIACISKELKSNDKVLEQLTVEAGSTVTMTTKEVAEALNVSVPSVIARAREIGKVFEHGVAATYTEEEVARISKALKSNTASPNSKVNLRVSTSKEMVSNIVELMSKVDETDREQLRLVASAGMKALDLLCQQLSQENSQLKHALQYDQVVGCHRWSDVKKLLGIKDRWEQVISVCNLEEEVDWFTRVMGYDKYPTIMIPDSTIEIIKEEYGI